MRMRISSAGILAAALTALGACASHPTAQNPSPRLVDDFEAYAVGLPPEGGPWRLHAENGRAVVDDTRAASGRQSVRIDLAGKGGVFLFAEGGPLFPAARDAMSGRMKVWLQVGPSEDVHWTLIEGRGVRRSDGHTGLVRFGGQHPAPGGGSRLMSNYETPDGYADATAPMSDCWAHAGETEVMPEGRWVDVAWRIAPQGLQLSLDGRAISGPDVVVSGQGCLHQPATYVWEIPAMERVSIGWESYQPDGPRTLWIDDVEIGD